MVAIFFRRRLIRVFISPQFVAPQYAVCIRSFSSCSKKSSSDVNGDDPNQSFTISYLINSCGLSSKDALSKSNKVTIKSPENPDSVLELLRKYGFTDANITGFIIRRPKALLSRPKKTLLPKLEFFRSIGIPLDVLIQKLSHYPSILHHSLENSIIPLYNFLKTLVKSDNRVVNVFKRAPIAFARDWRRGISSNIAILRERGIPESSIVSLVACQPTTLVINKEKLVSHIDRAIELGFDRSKVEFIRAIEVFAQMSESTLRQKIEVYRRCGWSGSDISLAFLKHPRCMNLSVKKIMGNMDFLVNNLGLQPDAVARCAVLLSLNVDKRMKPRFLVAKVLKEKGLLQKRIKVSTFLKLSEEKFLKRYVVNYQEDVPQLLDIYRGKLSVSVMEFNQEDTFK